MSINDLEVNKRDMISKVADDTKIGGAANREEEKLRLQDNIDGLVRSEER